MKHLTKREQIMISEEMNNWLIVLEEKYKIKRSEFIRKAIFNELKREVPKLRLSKQNQKDYCPF